MDKIEKTYREKLYDEMIYFLKDENISDNTKEKILRIYYSWSFTEKDENGNVCKYFGCPYWSEKALRMAFGDNCIETKEFTRNKNLKIGELRHEHIIPRDTFVKELEEYFLSCGEKRNEKFPSEKFYEKIKKNYVGCVITKGEDSRLNKENRGWEGPNVLFSEIENPWERYETYNNNNDDKIVIYKCDWTNKNGRWKLDYILEK